MLIFLVTFIVFFFEAMIHYNIGWNGHKNGINKTLHFPVKTELLMIIITIAIFSFINSLILNRFFQRR